MRIDLTKIDAQIKKLEEVRRIASDPELMHLLELVVVNGTNGAVRVDAVKESPLLKLREGTLVRKIADSAVAQSGRFTGYQLADLMAEQGHQFSGSAKPGATVADILKNVLAPKGIVRICKKGRGSDPTIFEAIT